MFYVAKGLQLAGLAGVGLALLTGMLHGEQEGAMTRELGGTVLGVAVFWLGRLIEPK